VAVAAAATAAQPAQLAYADNAEALLRRGWNPIPGDGKLPAVDDGEPLRWGPYAKRHAYAHEVLRWAELVPWANVLIPMGRGIVAVDLDTDDQGDAERYQAAADDILGPSPLVRIGRAPRTLRLYRGQIATQTFARCEILGRGRYAVMLGTHPGTGEPYTYEGASIVDVSPADLPAITPAQVRAFRIAVDPNAAAAEIRRRCTRFAVPTTRYKSEQVPRANNVPNRDETRRGIPYRDALVGVPKGQRHTAMMTIGYSNRARGVDLEVAQAEAEHAAARCAPPPEPRKGKTGSHLDLRQAAAGNETKGQGGRLARSRTPSRTRRATRHRAAAIPPRGNRPGNAP